MDVDTDNEASSDIDCAISEDAQKDTLNFLPAKSKERYEIVHNHYLDWRKEKGIEALFSEDVLLEYFAKLAEKVKPATLWTRYSILKTTISVNQNVDISQYVKLKAFLKRKLDGYKPNKAKTLTKDEINRFLDEAPDDVHLLHKTVLAIGISGACRRNELLDLKIDDIEDLGSAAVVKIHDVRTRKPRSFIITGEFYKYYKKYAALRPSGAFEPRFFLNYQNKKCTKQPVGINKLGHIPKQIAKYLGLKEADLYTGHCYRRSSATILVDAGGDIINLVRHGAWKSSDIADRIMVESHIEKLLTNKMKVPETTVGSIEDGSFSSSSMEQFSLPENILNVADTSKYSRAFLADIVKLYQTKQIKVFDDVLTRFRRADPNATEESVKRVLRVLDSQAENNDDIPIETEVSNSPEQPTENSMLKIETPVIEDHELQPIEQILISNKQIQVFTSTQTQTEPEVISQKATNEILESLLHMICKKLEKEHKKDQYDLFGEYVALKLRAMDPRQRILAEKRINDSLFYSDMGYLNEDTRLVVRSESPSNKRMRSSLSNGSNCNT